MTIEIANRLVALRKGKGLSQEELAERLGVSRQAVSKWERAETSPDLEKLITLSQLYGVTLDELLLERREEVCSDPETERPTQDAANVASAPHTDSAHSDDCQADETARCAEPSPDKEEAWERQEPSPEEDRAWEGARARSGKNSSKPKNSVHISLRDGIHVKDENGDVVDVSWKGIHVEEHGGDKVHVGPQGIHVEEPHGDRVNVSGSGVFVNGKPFACNQWLRFPYPIVALCLFMGWGFSGMLGGWKVSWLAFLTIPIYYAAATGIGRGKILRNSFALIVVLLFFVWGFSGWLGGWLYSWMIFLAIPLYYSALAAIRHRQAVRFCYPVLALAAFLVWGFWGGLGGFAVSWVWFLTIPLYYWVCRPAG